MSAPSTADSGCIFCRIVAGEIPSDRVAETEHTVVFRDIAPAMPVHVLIVPRRHIESAHTVNASDAAALADMLVCAQRVARSEGLAERGYRLVFNVGDDASNTVGHLHLHVLGGRAMGWPPG